MPSILNVMRIFQPETQIIQTFHHFLYKNTKSSKKPSFALVQKVPIIFRNFVFATTYLQFYFRRFDKFHL